MNDHPLPWTVAIEARAYLIAVSFQVREENWYSVVSFERTMMVTSASVALLLTLKE